MSRDLRLRGMVIKPSRSFLVRLCHSSIEVVTGTHTAMGICSEWVVGNSDIWPVASTSALKCPRCRRHAHDRGVLGCFRLSMSALAILRKLRGKSAKGEEELARYPRRRYGRCIYLYADPKM